MEVFLLQHLWRASENGLCYASTGNILNSKSMYHFPPKRVHKFEWHEFYFSSLERTEVAVVGRLSYKGGENGSQQGGGHDRTRKSTLCLHSRMRILCGPNLNCSALYTYPPPGDTQTMPIQPIPLIAPRYHIHPRWL